MAVTFKDYYDVLALSRDASQDAVKKAYRKLARKYHPDVNKDPAAEDKFKEATEAYEVLGDPKNREKYDRLGANWKAGEQFTPPSGWENVHFEFHTDPQFTGGVPVEDLGGFSDFFETLFGSHTGRAERRVWPSRGQDQEADLSITLEEAYRGAQKHISLQAAEFSAAGGIERKTKSYTVKIPPGTVRGARIRMAGQGAPGRDGGPAGDLFLRVHLTPHPRFHARGRHLETELAITPWEAALGSKIPVDTLDGKASLTIPPGTQSGSRLRLKAKGLPAQGKETAGDLVVSLRIEVPAELSSQERELFDQLRSCSTFDPRTSS